MDAPDGFRGIPGVLGIILESLEAVFTLDGGGSLCDKVVAKRHAVIKALIVAHIEIDAGEESFCSGG